MRFKYIAIDHKGKRFEGVYDTRSKKELIDMIRQRNLYPVKIQESLGSKQISLALWRKVKLTDIALFCRQFYVMIKSGLEIIKCLEMLSQETQNKRLRGVLAEAYEDVQKGLSLSSVMKNHREVFPDLLVQMIEVGELSGTLDVTLERMAIHYEKESKIKKKVKGAMVYPIILSTITIGIVLFLLIFIMPIFIGLFARSGLELPGPTKLMIHLSELVKRYWYMLIGGCALSVYLLRRFCKTELGRSVIDHGKLRLPVIKTITMKMITLRFTRTLSMLLASGITMIQSMEIVTKVIQNKKIEEDLMRVRDDIQKGLNLGETMKKQGMFSSMVISMMKIGEESGAMDEILNNTADYYDDEVEMALEKMVKLLEPLMIVIMAILVGSIVFAMILPMFDMFGAVNI